MATMRLDRFLSNAGAASRREVRELVRRGRITINGTAARSADEKVDPEIMQIALDGRPVVYSVHHYLMMNKPAGYVSATEDARENTVLELLGEPYSRFALFPAGRLDKETEGLLLLTDDGAFCHDVISPKKKVEKRYYAETVGRLTEADCAAFASGMQLADGLQCQPGRLDILDAGDTSRAYVAISEGKYHQVRRMLAALGKRVTYLKRISIGALTLDPTLDKGAYRELTEEERRLVFTKILKK